MVIVKYVFIEHTIEYIVDIWEQQFTSFNWALYRQAESKSPKVSAKKPKKSP